MGTTFKQARGWKSGALFILRAVTSLLCVFSLSHTVTSCLWRKGLSSGQSLKQQDLLVNAEPVQHHHQILATAGDLALHGQTEVLFHTFSDASGDRVVPEVSDRGTDRDQALTATSLTSST